LGDERAHRETDENDRWVAHRLDQPSAIDRVRLDRPGRRRGAARLADAARVIGRIAEIRKGRNLEVVPTGPPLIASREPHEIKPRARLLVEENDVAEVEFRHPQTDTSSAPVWLMNPAGLQVGTESAHPTG
jgi:hypothetical protein